MAKPRRIILVRHGQSEANVDHRVHQNTFDHEIGLTSVGVEQANQCGIKLRALVGNESVGFWLSPYRRTHQTLAGIAKAFAAEQVVHVFEDLRLREQHWGMRSDDEREESDRQREACGSLYFLLSGGEMGAQVYDRMTDFIDTICRDFAREDYRVENLIVVCHGYSMRCFAARWFHWPVSYFHSLKNPGNCEFFVLALEQAADGRQKYRLLTPLAQRAEVAAERDLKEVFFPHSGSASQEIQPSE